MSEDEFEYQGRSKEQYERNMKIGCFAAILFWGSVMAIFLYKMFWA